ncbi:MAG TPA: hypothetical protein DCY27_15050 [Desulfobacterales bacterium]|nr:hypothetical protein [Desulfobacterales bacterium]
MTECLPLNREMLPEPVDVTILGSDLDRDQAIAVAEAKARELASEVMLLAWFDRKTGNFSPRLTCCFDDKPSWLAYALSRGADLFIDINQEEYVFAYKKL